MIPLRDVNPSHSFPVMTIMIIIVNAMIFLYEVSLGQYLPEFLDTFALIPAQYFYMGDLGGVSAIARYFPFVTSQFLHGGWLHFIGNMWFLWIFGDNVEDRLGHFRFLIFYLLCGVIAGFAHVYTNPHSSLPTVGASGAIAGVMGAYTISFPQARVLTLFVFFFFIRFIELPAVVFLGVWFIFQFFSGTVALAAAESAGGVAWWAHIGGFVAGIALIIFIPKRKNWPRRRVIQFFGDDDEL